MTCEACIHKSVCYRASSVQSDYAQKCGDFASGKNDVLDKIKAEFTDCLKALDEIDKSGFNIYLPNEMSGRRLTYQQCIDIIDKYKSKRNDKE